MVIFARLCHTNKVLKKYIEAPVTNCPIPAMNKESAFACVSGLIFYSCKYLTSFPGLGPATSPSC